MWRAALIALAYVVGLVIAGSVATALGWRLPAPKDNSLVLMLMSGSCIGLTVALIVWRLSGSRWQRFALAACAVFFTMLSSTFEGAFFAPNLTGSVSALMFMDLVAAVAVGGAATLGSIAKANRATASFSWTKRPWYSWLWRFVVSAASYVIFYWFYGALNFLLVTRPYYTTQQHTPLQVPPAQTILVAEAIRGPLLVFAILPLILIANVTRRQLAISSSALLVIVGGIAPLLLEARALPTFLLIASGWEIFFQNVSLALVSAWLLGHAPNRVGTNSPEAAWAKGEMLAVIESGADLKGTQGAARWVHLET
jgi:hypothetical protein